MSRDQKDYDRKYKAKQKKAADARDRKLKYDRDYKRKQRAALRKPKLVIIRKDEEDQGGLGDRIVRGLEGLVITEGRKTGQHMEVVPWQRELVYGLADNVEVALSMARGNGKTTLVAGIAAVALQGALHRPRGQVAIVASSREQANIAFKHTHWFMKPAMEDEPRRWRLISNNQFSLIECKVTGMAAKVYGSDPNRAHGLSPSLLIMDEPAKWKGGGGRAMYAACVTSLGKQVDAKALAIGTRPEDDDHWFSEMLDQGDGDGVFVRDFRPEVSIDDGEWDDFALKHIRAANPSYDHLPDLRDEIHRQARKAERGGNDLAMFRSLRLNLGTPETMDHQPLISGDDWRALMSMPTKNREGPVSVGIDLGGGTSMSAVAFYWPLAGRLEVWGSLPASPNLDERGKLDYVGKRYVRMQERGELLIYPGKATNNSKFLEDMFEVLGPDWEILGVAADRYKQDDTEQSAIAAQLYDEIDFRPVGRGPTGAQDIIAFRQEVASGHMNMDESLLMSSAIKESKVGHDENNNPGLLKKRFKGRNDALAAALLAVGQGRRWRLPSKKPPQAFQLSDYVLMDETLDADRKRTLDDG